MKKYLAVLLISLSSFTAFADCNPQEYANPIMQGIRDHFPKYFVKAVLADAISKNSDLNFLNDPENWIFDHLRMRSDYQVMFDVRFWNHSTYNLREMTVTENSELISKDSTITLKLLSTPIETMDSNRNPTCEFNYVLDGTKSKADTLCLREVIAEKTVCKTASDIKIARPMTFSVRSPKKSETPITYHMPLN